MLVVSETPLGPGEREDECLKAASEAARQAFLSYPAYVTVSEFLRLWQTNWAQATTLATRHHSVLVMITARPCVNYNE